MTLNAASSRSRRAPWAEAMEDKCVANILFHQLTCGLRWAARRLLITACLTTTVTWLNACLI